MRKQVNWVLDADIRGFFDTIDHEWLVKFVEHRIADRRILRLIQKWLKAGVSEDGHLVEDGRWARRKGQWLHRCWRTCTCTTSSISGSSNGGQQSATGDMIVVRYADDIVVGFEHRPDAERFLQRMAGPPADSSGWSYTRTRRA